MKGKQNQRKDLFRVRVREPWANMAIETPERKKKKPKKEGPSKACCAQFTTVK